MGITIKSALEYLKDFDSYSPYQEAINKVGTYIEQYNARLKADMMAMLKELKVEIEELDTPSNGDAYMTCSDIIQQKINKLKENSHND